MKTTETLISFVKVFLGITVVILLLGSGVWYVRSNPQSMISYGLLRLGIDLFEPTYLERREGEELGFSLKSFASRSELDTGTVGFSACEESGNHPQARPRQYIIHDIGCSRAHHLGTRGRVELSYFNDRLAVVRFYSNASAEAYADAFREKFRVELRVGKSTRFTSNIFVKLQRTEDGFFLEWKDERLEKQNRSWISKHA